MSDQKTEQKPDHEKRIREAVASGETFSDNDLRALLADLDAARAALSEAKAGGWVAVPGAVYEDGGVSLIRRGTDDERCRNRGAVRLYAPSPLHLRRRTPHDHRPRNA